MNNPYYAVVFAHGEDGELIAEMPCFTHEQMMARAARYKVVLVKMEGKPTFRLRLKEAERDKYPLPTVKDLPLEWLRDYGKEIKVSDGEKPEHHGPRSDALYDIWHNIKPDRRW